MSPMGSTPFCLSLWQVDGKARSEANTSQQVIDKGNPEKIWPRVLLPLPGLSGFAFLTWAGAVAQMQCARLLAPVPSCQGKASLQCACLLAPVPSCQAKAALQCARLLAPVPSCQAKAVLQCACLLAPVPSCQGKAALQCARLLAPVPSCQAKAVLQCACLLAPVPSCQGKAVHILRPEPVAPAGQRFLGSEFRGASAKQALPWIPCPAGFRVFKIQQHPGSTQVHARLLPRSRGSAV